MKIEVLLTETEIAQEFSEAMQARDLPEKFFYWFPLSVRAWLRLSKGPAYAGLRRTWNIVASQARSIAEHFEELVPVVSLGAGDGSKDRWLLQALQKSKREVKYFPVDSSQSLLELACSSGEELDIETLGIKADISSPMHLVLAYDASESPKLVLMSGNTLGAFDPLDQVPHLSQMLREGDRLIVDGEIYSNGASSIRENPTDRAFAFAPLETVGITEADGEVRFEHKHDARHKGLHLTTKHFQAGRDLHLTLSGEEILLQRGERINMNFTYSYSPEAFRWLLTTHAQLKVLDEITSPDGRFLTAICAKR